MRGVGTPLILLFGIFLLIGIFEERCCRAPPVGVEPTTKGLGNLCSIL